MKKILITAPLRQDPDIFQAYQDALDEMIIPAGYTAERFFVVNDCPKVIPMIRNASYEVTETGERYEKTENDHLWTPELMLKMSELRNRTIQEMLQGGFDYWLSIDTDLIVHPNTLEALIEAEESIVSEIFWTQAPSGQWWCNAWMCDQATGFLDEWKKPGLYQVGMTGALTMVKREVFLKGVDYTPIPNIHRALRGEDRHFCVRAACAGFEMWIDTQYPARHLYTRALYEKYMKEKAGEVRNG